ncbi:unnamed protein product [Blepharisma stoltei]|uniref:Receptor ligand binding region domain-containing protein n=1 Tax=Blepharisma stoltei TaxID=1481888 RepID=A0AAU9JLC5_9CILI|nr:unnamed protein product [Blepharisma stoltei]
MITYFWFFLGFTSSQIFTIPILYSRYTDPLLVDYFVNTLDCSINSRVGCNLNLPYQYEAVEIFDVYDLEITFANSDYLFVFDGTFSLSMYTLVSQYAMEYGFIHFIYGNAPENALPYVIYSDFRFSVYRDLAIDFAKIYGIKKAIAIITSDFIEMDFNNDKGVEIVAQYTIPESAPYEYIFSLISKEIKPLGIKWFFFETNSKTSKLIQEALVQADMDKEGYTYIYMQEATWSAYLKGSILLEAKWYHSYNFYDYIEKIIYWTSVLLYEMIANNDNQGSYSAYALNTFAQETFTLDRIGYTVWNIQSEGTLTPVGTVHGGGIQIFAPIMFPGETFKVPNNEKIKIPISINGMNSERINAVNQLGATFALETIKNEGKLLPNFNISFNNITDCFFSDNSTYDCFKNYTEDLGYFHIPPADSSVSLSTIETFQSLNITTPIIGVETSTIMNSLDYYPQYTRVSYPNSITSSAAALILSIFSISKCSLLYSDSIWGKEFSEQFENQTESYGIQILNKIRAVPLGFNGTDKRAIQEIVDLKTRFVILEIQWPDILYVIEAFYDLGMREGDLNLIIGDGSISVSDLDEKRIGTDSYIKRKEIMSRLLYFTYPTFQNQIGLGIKNNFLSQYGFAYDNMCLFYDATYLGIYAINSLITRGINVDSSSIQQTIRDIKFTGCSGLVQITQDGNSRLTTVLGMYALSQVNYEWKLNLQGLYDPSQLIVLQLKQSFSNSIKVPSEIIGDDQKCPFKERQVRSFLNGYIILIVVEIIPIIIGTIFVIKFYNFIMNSSIEKLITVEKENFLDSLSYVLMLIECFQYMHTGKDINNFLPELTDITKLVIFNITGWNKKNYFNFWNQAQFFEIIAIVWFILFLWKKRKIGENSKSCFILGVNESNLYFLPFIGDSLFLPICLNLFQTFQCTSSIGDSFYNSFHDRICSTFCWQGEHIYYVVISSIAICLYMPTSIYCRPLWKNDLSFHFQEQPFHFVLKSYIQMVFIILHTIVLPASEIIFIGLCIGLFFIYVVITIYKKPFNYERASMWYIIFLSFSLLFWICCGISKGDKIAALAVLVVGWTLLIIFGIFYQKMRLPSLLISERGIDIYHLFRFQLTSSRIEDSGITNLFKYAYSKQDLCQKEEEIIVNKINVSENSESENKQLAKSDEWKWYGNSEEIQVKLEESYEKNKESIQFIDKEKELNKEEIDGENKENSELSIHLTNEDEANENNSNWSESSISKGIYPAISQVIDTTCLKFEFLDNRYWNEKTI